MMHATPSVSGRILWTNLHLLFWLSLIPFVTAWLGESHGSTSPTALYGVVLLLSAISYTMLQRAIIRHHGSGSQLAAAVGRDAKGKISIAGYAAAIALAFPAPWLSDVIYASIAAMWFIPDRRIESVLQLEPTP
jgi:uncharacterized membrane protein